MQTARALKDSLVMVLADAVVFSGRATAWQAVVPIGICVTMFALAVVWILSTVLMFRLRRMLARSMAIAGARQAMADRVEAGEP